MEAIAATIDEVAINVMNASEFLEVDLLVIGGGPAGLSAGIYSERNGINTVVIEKGKLGGQVLDTSYVENYPGIKKLSGTALADIMSAHAMDYVTVFENEAVTSIIPGSPFLVFTDKHVINTKAVIIATGAKRRSLGLPEENRYWSNGLSYSPTKDGQEYSGKSAFIVGGGDSAVTEAIHLKELGVDISLVHRSDQLDAQQTLIDRLESMNIPVLYNMEVAEILGDIEIDQVVLYNNQTGLRRKARTNGLFVSIGYVPALDLAEKLGLKLTDDSHINHDSCRTSIPGLYVAGDIAGGFKQIVTASSQGAEAALTVHQDIKTGIL